MTTPIEDERPVVLVVELLENEGDVRARDCDDLVFDLCVEIHFLTFLETERNDKLMTGAS